MIGLRAERATRNNDRLNWQHAPPYLYKGCRLVCVRDLSRPNPGARPVGSSRGRRPRAVAVMAQLASRSFTCLWSEWWREGGVLRRWLVTLTLLALALIAWDISTSETTVTTLSGRVRYGSFVVSLPKTFVLYEESSAPRRMLGVRPTAWYGTLGETWRVEIGWDSLPRGLEGVEGREAAISLLARARIPGTLKDYEYYWESGANMDCLCAVLKPSENFVFRAFGYAVGKGDYLWIRVVSPAGDVNLDAKAILVGIVKETKVRLQ